MAYEERKTLINKIEDLRSGRRLICFFNFDKLSDPQLPGFSTTFSSDAKEALFRVLKESSPNTGIDLCLYTRGGDTNAVWPIVSLVREFDPNFQVLIPFRCHSSGTLVALGAAKIVMGPISELSPIDPSTANQFNPRDPSEQRARLAISVEDVRAYKSFVLEQYRDPESGKALPFELLADKHLGPYIERLASEVHPLALGNVQRALMQIIQLASRLLKLHPSEEGEIEKIVTALTTDFYSHLHMVNRHEAKEILGQRVEFAANELASALDELLRNYEDAFKLRHTFFLNSHLSDKQEASIRLIGGIVESKSWSYLYETKGTVRQFARVPQNVQIQIPHGQPMPIIPGLPRETQVEITSQGWIRNTDPKGVTA